ncbi:hypothetical protein V6N12_045863 [Hibiscus sabdariffa]|uniref:Disease resistance protein n=1 Tax=Hibiscus sabdariffa TaxID=183260 RepID=A0ABR2G3Z2_9ROSI
MSNGTDMETQAFAKMQRLKLLQLDYVKLRGDFKEFPKSLIWLCWHGFHIQSLPVDFIIKRLVVLDMHNSNLKHVWKDKENLLKTPDFSGLPSLERLMLKDCIKLTKVDQSIGELKMLNFLNLKDCKSLRKLPRTIGSLVSLEELILSSCSRLYEVPRELHNMNSLKKPISLSTESIKGLTKLDELVLTSCTELRMIPKLPIFSDSIEVLATMPPPLKYSLTTLPWFFYSKSCVILGCERLIEVQEIFKLEPFENFEAKEVK